MTNGFRTLVLAGVTSLGLLTALASGAQAESRNGRTLPSREMVRSQAMMHRPMMHRHRMWHRHYRHSMRYRHHMMRHHTM